MLGPSPVREWIRKRELGHLLLAGPCLLLFLAFYAYPLEQILQISLFDPFFTVAHYAHFFTVPVYLRVLLNTFKLALLITCGCLILGYPVAYLLATAKTGVRNLLFILVLLPLWTSVLVRTYAWMVILQREGIVNKTLATAGLLSEPVQLVYNTIGVTIGLVHVLLPYMIMPLYAAMIAVDPRLVPAARTLGATRVAAFWTVFVPLTLPGITAGGLLVFVSTLGAFVTPALLGGPQDQVVSQLIEMQVNTSLNAGFASAIAFVMLAVTIAIYLLYDRLVGLDRVIGAEARR